MPTSEVPVLSQSPDVLPVSTSLVLQGQEHHNENDEDDGSRELASKRNRPRNYRSNNARSVRFSDPENTSRSGSLKEDTDATEKAAGENQDEDGDFFVREWSKVEQVNPRSSSQPDAPQNDGQLPPPVQESPTALPPPTTSSAPEVRANELIIDQSLFYVDSKQRKQNNKNGTYIPPETSVDWSTHFETSKPTLPEDDGLYVGLRPIVSPPNINSMEQRVLAEKAFHWIDTDWKLKVVPNPTNDGTVGTRCIFEHERDVLNSLMVDSVPLMDNLNVTGKSGRNKRLEMILELVGIEFQHHHLFSLEHVYARQLEERYENYRAWLEEDEPLFLTQRIRGLRTHLDTLKVAFDNVERESELDQAELTLSNCLKEIQQLREKRDESSRKQQVALVGLVDTWAELKVIRAKNGFISTPVQLVLKLMQPNETKDLNEYQADVEEELEEKEMLHMLSNTVTQVTFNRSDELHRIEERLGKSRRRPGKPILVPDLQRNGKVTEQAACSAAERARRSEVPRNKLFAKVLINAAEVCRTTAHALNDDFVTFLSKKVSIFLDRVPSSIKVEVYEEVGMRNRKLAETYIPVPDEQAVAEIAKTSTVGFSVPDSITGQHNSVGSGVPFSTNDGKTSIMYTTANICYSTAWSTETASRFAESKRKENFGEPIKILSSGGIRNMDKLLEWIESAKLDPNDPTNAELIQLANDLKPTLGSNYFRLEPLQQMFDFCTDEDITTNKRFQLLRQRDEGATEFAHMKMIPANEGEVFAMLLAEDKKRVIQENGDARSAGMTKQQQQYNRSMQKVRAHIATAVRNSNSVQTYGELVKEPTLSIGQFFEFFTGFWSSSANQKQGQQHGRMISLHELGLIEMQIVVRIDKAENLPVRSSTPNQTGPSANKNIDTGLLRPVVIVRFGAQEKVSEVSSGPNPIWNKELSFRVRPAAIEVSDFLEQSLEIHLYDEIAVDVLEDEMLRKTHIFQRLDKRWLGSVTIPISVLCSISKIENTFPLQVPPVLLGYKPSISTGSSAGKNSTLPQVTLSLHLEPSLSPPRPLKISKLETTESSRTLDVVESAMSSLKRQFPDRYMEPLVITRAGKTSLLTRYIRLLNPPPGLTRDDMPLKQKMVLLARYVSLIPVVADKVFQPEMFDVWFTNEEFLQDQCGGSKEHSLLLLSYFKFLNVAAYLMFGRSINGGPDVSVLSRSGDRQTQWTVWNATTGKSFEMSAQNNPVTDVGMLVDAKNIWLNIQRTSKPKEMQWDLANTAHWKPLWTAKQMTSEDLTSVQPESFVYEIVPPHLKHEREVILKNAIVADIMTERSQYITRWNIECDRKLYGLLEMMEAKVIDETPTDLSALQERELRDLLQVYEIYGFPLNMPYSSVQEVVKAVTGKGVHKVDSNNVEFSLAVSVSVYHQIVASVWIYFAVLSRKSQN